ncbi:hypothetical protein GCK72_010427 [Caenorhabditis remanei]|uniref:Uncharacterized protein n=2 Tax=Caenorhabditis remanei TaxID=31234 RepID=A0A6A5H542_CAERE|nr:hypothetical protein GCK72_010427 [Caenorhabditis remanei]KAF1762165.1 hypothetical protein GCK72_010427 [Caenorhabditis remanei]
MEDKNVKKKLLEMSRHLLSGGNNTLHSEQIRAEIQRFESVHPCIYQIYDLLNLLPDGCHAISEQIREQIVSVEGMFSILLLE